MKNAIDAYNNLSNVEEWIKHYTANVKLINCR